MGRYTYSPTGALKWKKDVSEYAEALRGYGVPAVDEEMASLEQVGFLAVHVPVQEGVGRADSAHPKCTASHAHTQNTHGTHHTPRL